MTTVVDPVAAEEVTAAGATQRPGRTRRTVIGYLALLIAVTAAVVGARLLLHSSPHRVSPVSVAHPAAPAPSNPEIEAAWGVRFTNVIVLADNGGVELRYQVLDHSKAERLHLGDPSTSNELPTILVEGTHSRVTPSAVLMHFHHGDTVAGESYSIVYGNAGGVVHNGDYVTLIMKDGLKLKHIQVSD